MPATVLNVFVVPFTIHKNLNYCGCNLTLLFSIVPSCWFTYSLTKKADSEKEKFIICVLASDTAVYHYLLIL